MKKLLIFTMIALGISLISCSDDAEQASSEDLVQELDVEAEATLESNFEDIDLIVGAGMETLTAAGRVDRDAILDCATITHDEENKKLTIDYGDGCEGPGGRIRAGIIEVTYNDHRLVPGAFRQTTFVNFSIDEVQIEGTRRVDNISESEDDNPTFAVTLTGGKMTFDDETMATREASRVRTWIRANNPLNDTTEVTGGASGTKRDGVSYEMEIIERLVYKRACWSSKVFIPVSGVKQFTSGDNTAIVDYGDGTCDNEVTITINDGEPFTKTISPRGRRR